MKNIFLLLLLIGNLTGILSIVKELGPYKISDVSVSGISSGGYMAVQFHVAFSATVNGSAIFAGGPFYCAESTLAYAENRCMGVTLGAPNTDELIALTWADASLNYIDSPVHLADDKVYIFSGKDDSVVNSKVVHSLQSYYTAFVKPGNIVANYDISAEHCLPTIDYGEPCATLASPYLGNCNFDGAGAALKTIYGNNLKSGNAIETNLKSFDQTSFIKRTLTSIADTGYIYVPTNCADGKASCSLHISFHGCEQNVELIGSAYAEHAGFNSWAEANNIIVLYPYVKPSHLTPYNPNGCWDWWAYTDVYYGVKKGVQMDFVKQMVDYIKGSSKV